MGDSEEKKKELKTLFTKKIYSMDEVSKHNTEESPWVVIYGAVYDMTDFQLDHPGGPDVIQDIAGLDSTDEFENILHTEKARKMGHKFLIGSIEGADFDNWIQNMNTTKKEEAKQGESNYLMFIIVFLAIIVSVYFYTNQSNQ